MIERKNVTDRRIRRGNFPDWQGATRVDPEGLAQRIEKFFAWDNVCEPGVVSAASSERLRQSGSPLARRWTSNAQRGSGSPDNVCRRFRG